MSFTFPDRCISYLQKQRTLRNLRIHDYSQLIFNGQQHCFHSSISAAGRRFHGIGADRDIEVAASKSMAELIERILSDRIFENTISGIFACGTAFHPNLEDARRASQNELLERLTLSACLFADSNLVSIKSSPHKVRELPFLRDCAPDSIVITLTELVFFRTQPVFFVELSDSGNSTGFGNGAGYQLKSRKNGIEKALLEAYRRYAFSKIMHRPPIPLLRPLFERSNKTIFPQFRRIDLNSSPKPKTRQAHIPGLGHFVLRYFPTIPRPHPAISHRRDLKKWYNLSGAEWADTKRSCRILA